MEWISIKDRLPEDEELVVIFNGSDDEYPILTAKLSSPGPNGTWYEPIHHEWDIDFKFVSHWMPLPKPPNQEKNDTEHGYKFNTI
jgi:hypothetical protein